MRPNCHGHTAQTGRIEQYIKEGKDHDAILAAFVQEFGSQAVLAAPIDRGFNRLAWLFPYLVAAAALVGVVLTARRWSHRAAPASAGGAGFDPELNARLDDELNNLD
jgi:cytochrome c-type biogenesis protein CcmH/NrfF